VSHETMTCAGVNDRLENLARALHRLLAVRHGERDARVVFAVKTKANS